MRLRGGKELARSVIFLVIDVEMNHICRAPELILFFFLVFIYLFIFDCAGSYLLRGLLSSCGEQRLLSSCVWASHWGDFSCCRARTLGHLGSVVAVPGV